MSCVLPNSLWFQVNNAGIVQTGTIESTSLEQYDKVMNINMRSIYHLTMLCVPHIVATKGSIVNVSSVNGTRAVSIVIVLSSTPHVLLHKVAV